jgi:hypothetical protein
VRARLRVRQAGSAEELEAGLVSSLLPLAAIGAACVGERQVQDLLEEHRPKLHLEAPVGRVHSRMLDRVVPQLAAGLRKRQVSGRLACGSRLSVDGLYVGADRRRERLAGYVGGRGTELAALGWIASSLPVSADSGCLRLVEQRVHGRGSLLRRLE